MKLDARRLATHDLRLELPAPDGRTNLIALGRSGGVTGAYEQDHSRIRLGEIRGEQLTITALSWCLPEGASASAAAGRLDRVLIDAEIPLGRALGRSPFVGRLEVGEAQATALRLVLAGLEVSADATLAGVAFRQGDDGANRLEVARVRLRGLRLAAGALPVAADDVELEDLCVSSDAEGELSVTARRVALASVRIERGPLLVVLGGVGLGDGVRFARGAVSFAALSIDEIDVRIADLGQLTAAPAPAGELEPEPAPATPSAGPERRRRASAVRHPDGQRGREPADLRLLDRLNGQIDVDLTADTTVPLIGQRKATHHFRIPIADGTINYREFERDLASLEDAFIDIEVRDGKLSLEKDIPLLPFYHKTLLYWHLSEHDLALAKQRLVRLRTFFLWQIPEPRRSSAEADTGDDADKTKLAVRKLDFESIDIDLSLIKPAEMAVAGGVLRLGSAAHPGFEQLSIDGDLRYHAAGDVPPSALSLSARAIHVGLDALAFGGAVVSIDTLEIPSIVDAKLVLAGVQPGAAGGVIRGLTAANTTIVLPPSG